MEKTIKICHRTDKAMESVAALLQLFSLVFLCLSQRTAMFLEDVGTHLVHHPYGWDDAWR